MESGDKNLQVFNSNESTVSIPKSIPASVSVPTSTSTSIEAGSLDIAFLINIIRGLENTILVDAYEIFLTFDVTSNECIAGSG